jgi:hypothetical protein
MFAGRRGDGSLLTGGGRLAGIDVADNDHVDVHLFLTADTRDVSQESIKIDAIVAIIAMMLLMEEGRIIDVDSPHGCGIEFSSVLCGILVFLREEVESDDKDVSNDECNGVFDDILTAQSDCLNQGMCRRRARGKNFEKVVEG